MDLQRAQLCHQIAVPTRCIRLTLERAQLAPNFAKQILNAQQAGFGRIETTLGPLLATSELQHARRFLDD